MGLIDKVDVVVNGAQDSSKALVEYNTVILKQNIRDSRNMLTQQMMSHMNTKYVIKWAYTLAENIVLPKNCLIEFDGGSIKNDKGNSYTLTGDNTILIYSQELEDVVKGVELEGTFIHKNCVVADEEDLTVEHSDLLGIDTLKLADRPSTDGMGYIILRKNKSFVEQVTKANTIYEIRYEFDLGGAEVTIPEGSVLKFDGGRLKNGAIICKKTYIYAENYKILGVQISGVISNTSVFADWFNSIQDAVDILYSSGGGRVILSPKLYELTQTLVLKSYVSLEGSGNPGAYNDKGTIIKYTGTGDVINISGVSGSNAKNIKISDLKVWGNGTTKRDGTNSGIKIGELAHYCILNNVSVYCCKYGVHMKYSWNLDFKAVNVYYCDSAFFAERHSSIPITSSTFSSCVAYTSNIGFNMQSDLNAITFVGCATDSCDTSAKFEGCFGVVVAGYEFEQCSDNGIVLESIDCNISLLGISPRAIRSEHKDDYSHIKIVSCKSITFTDMYISQSVYPTKENSYSIDVIDSSYSSKVTFVNCTIGGKMNNIEKCNFIGGNYGNRLPKIYSFILNEGTKNTPIDTSKSPNIIAVDPGPNVGIKYDAERIFTTLSGYYDGEIIEFRNIRKTPFKISTEFRNGVERPDGNSDTEIDVEGYGIVRFIVQGTTIRLSQNEEGSGTYKFTLSQSSASNTIDTQAKIIVIDNFNVPDLKMTGTKVIQASNYVNGDVVEIRNIRKTPFKIATTINNGFESVTGVQEITIEGYGIARFVVRDGNLMINK